MTYSIMYVSYSCTCTFRKVPRRLQVVRKDRYMYRRKVFHYVHVLRTYYVTYYIHMYLVLFFMYYLLLKNPSHSTRHLNHTLRYTQFSHGSGNISLWESPRHPAHFPNSPDTPVSQTRIDFRHRTIGVFQSSLLNQQLFQGMVVFRIFPGLIVMKLKTEFGLMVRIQQL